MLKKTFFFLFVSLIILSSSYADTAEKSISFSQKILEFGKRAVALIVDNALAISITIIFLSALLGFLLKGRSVDKCLKDFVGFKVALENHEGEVLSGNMLLYSTGIELEQEEANESKQYFTYIFYKKEFGDIYMVYRYQDLLTQKNEEKRAKDIRKTYKPGLLKKLLRWFRNILGSFKDAFSQSLGVLLGHVKKMHPGSTILKNQQKDITNIGNKIIGYAGNTYDPILEKYIGRKVVVEICKGESTQKYIGIFKEYSSEFLEVLNIALPAKKNYIFPKEDENKEDEKGLLLFRKTPKNLKVRNNGKYPVHIKEITIHDESHSIEKVLEPQKDLTIKLNEVERKADSVQAVYIRQADIIVPRTHAVIRHAGDKEKADWKSLLKVDFIYKV